MSPDVFEGIWVTLLEIFTLAGERIADPDVSEGIRVTLLGMVLEFIILGLVLLCMVILERLFRPAAQGGKAAAPAVAEVEVAAPVVPEKEVVAAAAVALAHAAEEEKRTQAKSSHAPAKTESSGWRAAGRQQQTGTRDRRGR